MYIYVYMVLQTEALFEILNCSSVWGMMDLFIASTFANSGSVSGHCVKILNCSSVWGMMDLFIASTFANSGSVSGHCVKKKSTKFGEVRMAYK